MIGLILFYFKQEPKNFDDVAKYWYYIEKLEKSKLLPTPTIPLELK